MSSEALLRLDKFTKLFPVHFSGTPSEDPHDYLDRFHEVLWNMGIVETNEVDFAVFQMADSAKRWWRDSMLTRPGGSPTLTWEQFSQLFLGKFLPITFGASSRGRGNFGRGHPPRPFHSAIQASYSSPPAPISAPSIRGFQGGYSGRQGQFQGQQSQQTRTCYSCDDLRHIARFCLRSQGSMQQQGSRAMVPAPVTSPPSHPARGRGQVARGGGQTVRGGGQAIRGGGHPVRGRPRDTVQSGVALPRFYALPARPKVESSDAVITCIVPVCHRDASVLFDPGSTYSYVSSYFASYRVIPRDSMSALVCVHSGGRFYHGRSCLPFVCGYYWES
ncbi:uncharacterized protein [Nicotiana tomentosiformis]|uniref:uncharacterized protein n=1 Tax=Nicotiana tomentosiformis TaxID=4098 RepID=UPI00388C57D9